MTRRPVLTQALLAAVGLAVCLALLVPFVHRQNAWPEWANYFWLVKEQARSMRVLGHPTLFLHQDIGLFYPQYVFYGGGLWTVTAALALALGSAWTAFVVVLALAVVVAYAGAWWLGAQLGLGAWAHAPALAVVTSPYVVMGNLYGRGDWSEIVAAAMLPLAFAGALDLQRHPAVRLRALAAVTAVAAVVAGSHPLTFFWGAIFAVACVAVLFAVRRGAVRWDRLALAAGAAAVGVGLDAWYLLPGLSLAHETRAYATGQGPLSLTEYNQPHLLFSLKPEAPFRADRPTSSLRPQLPVLVGAWALAAGAVAVWRPGPLRRAWLGLAAIVGMFLGLILDDSVWPHLPGTFRQLQFAFRLQTYVVLGVAGLVVCGLLAVRGRRWARAWQAALVVALLAQVAYCRDVARTTDPPDPLRVADLHVGTLPQAFGGNQQVGFEFPAGRELPRPKLLLAVEPKDALGERITFTTPFGSHGQLFATNVFASPLTRVSGDVEVAGHDRYGHYVVRAIEGAKPVVVEPAVLTSVRLGRTLTVAAFAAIAAALYWRARGRRRRRRRRLARS